MLETTDKHQGGRLVSALTLSHQEFRVIRGVSGAQDGRGALGPDAKIVTAYIKCFMMN